MGSQHRAFTLAGLLASLATALLALCKRESGALSAGLRKSGAQELGVEGFGFGGFSVDGVLGVVVWVQVVLMASGLEFPGVAVT